MATGHHTKDKGDLAVAKVQADLIERGATVLLPLTEHAPFDLVAYLDNTFFRVQVKYRTVSKGAVNVMFRSSWADRHGTHHRPLLADAVDIIAIFCPNTSESYYVNRRDFRTSVSIRITPSRNNQTWNIVPASACQAFPPATSVGARCPPPDRSDDS
jgi:hypothetical protein